MILVLKYFLIIYIMKGINIWISDNNINSIVSILEKTLATENVVNLKIRKYHWNIDWENFNDLHKFFEELYDSSAENIDEIAERIRMLWVYTKASFKEYLDLSIVSEDESLSWDYKSMVINLLKDKESIIVSMREDIEKVWELWDVWTEDFLTGLIQKHEKDAWMIRSILK